MTEIASPTTRRKGLWRAVVALQSFLLIAGLMAPGSVLAGPSPTGATIASDKADYAPGSTVTLTGAGWAPGEAVVVNVDDSSGQVWSYTQTDTAAADGTFTDVFQLPSYFISNYNVKATGPVSGVATSSFTDGNVDIYDQCANGTGATPGPLCNWTNGNLNGQNSTYPEGTATLQALSMSGFAPGSTHTATLNYGTTKQGKHAYDYLTQWDWSEGWVSLSDRCQGVAGCTTAAENVLAIPNDPNVTDTIELAGPGARNFVMRGATMTNATVPAIVSGTYAGDSDTAITITFTVGPSNGSMCSTKGNTTTCGIMLWFGAHVSRSDLWTAFNNTTGAGTVSGSPYHVAISAVDGAAIGNRDNQMQANAVVAEGSLVLTKVFSAGTSGYTGTFGINYTCSDGTSGTANLTAGGSATVTPILAGATCTVTEPTLPSVPGYAFGTPTFNPSSGVVTVAANTSVTVATTNSITQNTGSLVLSKVFDPGTSGYTGTFGIQYDCSDGTAHDGTANLTAGQSTTISGIPSGTTCTVTEPTLPSVPGYTFGTPTFNPVSGVVTIPANQGGSVSVATTNTITRNTGGLVLSKVFTGDTSGYSGNFTIGYDCSDGTAHDGSVTLAAGASQTITGIPEGTTCTVVEGALPSVPGYTWGTPSYTPASGIVTIPLAQDATVSVATHNTITQNTGGLVLSKVFTGDTSGYSGNFTIGYDCSDGTAHDGSVTLAAGASQTITGIPEGTTCTVVEGALPSVPGYTWGTPVYDPVGATVTIPLAQDATVSVTTYNSILKLPTLTIIKTVRGSSATFSYTVTGANSLSAPTTNLTPPANGSAQYGPVVIAIGSSTISEDAPPSGWVLTDVVCTGYSGGGTGAGSLDANGVPTSWNFNATYGDNVVCSYVNEATLTTRTQGFWATHTVLANAVWNGTSAIPGATPLGVDAYLCTGTPITAVAATGQNQLMGGFWASVTKKSTGQKRSNLDQVRMQMLQQYLAAVLNVHAFGSGSEAMLAAARTAYCGTNAAAIQAQIGILGSFNTSGDNGIFTPGASATSQLSKSQANIPFWDITYR